MLFTYACANLTPKKLVMVALKKKCREPSLSTLIYFVHVHGIHFFLAHRTDAKFFFFLFCVCRVVVAQRAAYLTFSLMGQMSWHTSHE